MNKYTIEENINFFEELYKSLDIEENELKTDEDNNKCLITNTILTDKYVELICGHKFNYIPLYHDLVNHKNKFNIMESSSSRLNINEIRCPYCRNKEVRTLPYYEELGLEKINGVNFYDPNIKQIHKNEKCCYLLENTSFNPFEPESNHNIKYLKCGAFNTSKIIIYNTKNPTQPITYGDDKCYCYNHIKIMIKKYKQKEKEDKQKEKEDKQKEKEENKQIKLKVKGITKAVKELEKLEKLEAKTKTKKIISSNINSENVILEPSVICNQIDGCIQILKSGPNKGNICGCKISYPLEKMCKRHYLQNHKN